MSGNESDDLERGAFIIVRGGPGGQDLVLSAAAWELQLRATAESAVYRHAGYIPDKWLAPEATIPAAELCLTGMWERVDDGYRVLDREAVEVCVERVRELDTEQAEHERRVREDWPGSLNARFLAEQFRFGRESDGVPAAPRSWADLDL
jgi:hypothetical protein